MSYKEIPFRRTVTKTLTERRRVAIISPTMSESDMLDVLAEAAGVDEERGCYLNPPHEDTLVFMRLGQIPPGGAWRKHPDGAKYVAPIASFYRLTGCPDDGPKRLGFAYSTPGSFTMEARDRLVLVRLGDYLPNVGWHFEDK